MFCVSYNYAAGQSVQLCTPRYFRHTTPDYCLISSRVHQCCQSHTHSRCRLEISDQSWHDNTYASQLGAEFHDSKLGP